MSKPEIFREPIPKATIARLAEESFGDMIKFVVDLHRRVICAGGGLHSDAEAILRADGSQPDHLWGANFYMGLTGEDRFEYKSMINIRPLSGNTQQHIARPEIRQQVREAAGHFFSQSP